MSNEKSEKNEIVLSGKVALLYFFLSFTAVVLAYNVGSDQFARVVFFDLYVVAPCLLLLSVLVFVKTVSASDINNSSPASKPGVNAIMHEKPEDCPNPVKTPVKECCCTVHGKSKKSCPSQGRDC